MLSSKCISCGMRVPIKGNEEVALCDNCNRLYFAQVKKYIYDNHGASITEMHKRLGIPITVLEKFLDDDRLFSPEQQKALREEKNKIENQEAERKHQEETLRKIMDRINEPVKTPPKEESKSSGNGMRFIDTSNKGRGRR